MTHAEQQQALVREIGQKIQECRALVDRVEGGAGVRAQLDKVMNKIANWSETNRAELERPTQAPENGE